MVGLFLQNCANKELKISVLNCQKQFCYFNKQIIPYDSLLIQIVTLAE